MSYQSLFAKTNEQRRAEDAAYKAQVQREENSRQPAAGFGISVKEAALRLGVSKSTIYRRIRAGKFQSAFKSPSKAGGRSQLWVSGVEVFEMSQQVISYRESDLH